MNDHIHSDRYTRPPQPFSQAIFQSFSQALSPTIARILLRHGQSSAARNWGLLAIWLLCVGTISLTLWIWPAQERVHGLEAALRVREVELHRLDARLREAQALNNALQSIPSAGPQMPRDPWPYLQRLAQARSVDLVNFTPLAADPERTCQPLRLEINGTSLRIQALLQDFLRSPHTVKHFSLTPDNSGTTSLALQICMSGTESRPVLTAKPSIALFQPTPKHKPRTILEELPVSDYRVIAVGRAEHDHYALLRTPSGKIYTVRPGMRLGERGGQVIAIHPNGIEVQQDTDRLSLQIGSPP